MMVLITGVKGFIGHHLYDYLMDEGYDVKSIDDCSGLGWEDRDVPHTHCDITKDPAPFIDAKFVIHLAARAGVRNSWDPDQLKDYSDVNIKGTSRIFNSYRNSKILYASSSSVYGANKKIPFNKYLSAIYDSSINLALEGKGEFTFRHLEILANCSFMICQNSINNLELPFKLIDGKHFVSFKNEEDLTEKINFYLKNDELRKEIALNGRKVLEENYSPKKHGEFLFSKIFQNNV